MATSLKYMGMGSLVKHGQKTKEDGEAERTQSNEAGPSRPPGPKSTFSGWAGFNRTAAGEMRKKNDEDMPEENEEEDRKIRFTIGGEGRRMTKDDFLKEIQKMDPRTRREVLAQSDAPQAVKAFAKEQARRSRPSTPDAAEMSRPAAVTAESNITETGSKTSARPQLSPQRGRSGTVTATPVHEKAPEIHPDAPSTDTPETAVERRRRLAALSGMRDEEENPGNEAETPAERRRREAALGMGGSNADESDSEDDDTPRVPNTRRGIRFADVPPPKGRA
jgi:hypothetical protein